MLGPRARGALRASEDRYGTRVKDPGKGRIAGYEQIHEAVARVVLLTGLRLLRDRTVRATGAR